MENTNRLFICTKVIDELGRIVLPREIREKYDLLEKSELDIIETEEGILLKSPEKRCNFCHGIVDELAKQLNHKYICQKCLDLLNK